MPIMIGGEIIRSPKKSYTPELLHEVLSQIFGAEKNVSRKHVSLVLENFSKEKKWSKRRAESVLGYLIGRRFCRASGGEFVINSLKFNALKKGCRPKDSMNDENDSLQKKARTKRRRELKLRSIKRAFNEDVAVALKVIFGENKSEGFQMNFFQRCFFDLIYAHLHYSEENLWRNEKDLRQNQVEKIIQKLIKIGIIVETSELVGMVQKHYIWLTEVGAVYCGLEDCENYPPDRISKDVKFSQQFSVLPQLNPAIIHAKGLRTAKKIIKRLQLSPSV